ncbi:hypothetical protein N657DRAFT_67782 [Parathielavia appendiculata]|uniref:Secreted protein n=1 Tax=Parathielavia appendiculata TaxID=2587402 RepID=A0AAN6UAN7_9PEZI|nr:hypothetical protein N657DRAFT_67782 [Parathielavia appendiculata]
MTFFRPTIKAAATRLLWLWLAGIAGPSSTRRLGSCNRETAGFTGIRSPVNSTSKFAKWSRHSSVLYGVVRTTSIVPCAEEARVARVGWGGVCLTSSANHSAGYTFGVASKYWSHHSYVYPPRRCTSTDSSCSFLILVLGWGLALSCCATPKARLYQLRRRVSQILGVSEIGRLSLAQTLRRMQRVGWVIANRVCRNGEVEV